MKARILCAGLFAILTAAYFVACGGDDSSVKSVAVPEIESADDLDSCSKSNEGDTVYVAEEDAYYLCHKKEWTKMGIPDSVEIKTEKNSSSSKKSSSSGKSSDKSGKSSSSEKSSDAKDKSSSSGKSSSSKAGSSTSVFVEECKEGIPDVCANNEKGVGVITTCIRGKLIEYSCRTAACNEKGDDCDMNMSKIECTEDDTPSVCTNDGKGIGTVKACIKGRKVEYSCRSVSCNEDGNDCGECVNNVTTCTDDEDLKGTVTKCEDGKKIEEKCGNVSCDGNSCGKCLNFEQRCTNDINGEGRVTQCVNGRFGSTMMTEQCENGVSCKRTKVGIREEPGGSYTDQMKFTRCGVCVDGDHKCENDEFDNGVMYRCFEGEWHEIKSSYQTWMGFKYDDDGYLMWNSCGNSSCGVQSIYVQDTGRYNHNSSYEFANISLTGYYPLSGKVETFLTTMIAHDSSWNPRVSCDADGKMLGVCHNSIRMCINEVRGARGYLVVCQGGRLMDFDGNGDNIACHCQASGNNSGGCSSGRNCYAANNNLMGKAMCEPPSGGY